MSNKETRSSGTQGKRPDRFAQAVEALKHGDVIVFPTETLYGLGANALNRVAVERVFLLKGRDPKSPIPIIISDQAMLRLVATEVPPLAVRLIQRFWPGPLTLILPGRKELPAPLLSGDGGIGVRISSQPLATRLTQALNGPLTATSANPSGREAARTVREAMSYFSDKVKVFLDGGTLASKTGSTVIDVRGKSITMLREGEISASQLEQALETDE